jgi:hypothetical protein
MVDDMKPSWQDMKLNAFFHRFDPSLDMWENVKLTIDEARNRYWSYETLKKAIDKIKEIYGQHPKADL